MDFKKLTQKTCLAFAFLAFASQANQGHAKNMSLNITQDFIIPAYDSLAKNAAIQASDWQAFCKGQAVSFEKLKGHFHQVGDDWQHVQHIIFGPVTSYLRRERFYFWPERRNNVSRQLNSFITAKDMAALDLKNFSRGSVAGQGLPALERLLFVESYDLNDPFTCLLGQTIAENIANIATETAQEWVSGDMALLPKIQQNQKHVLYFENQEEVTNRLFTQFVTGFEMITNQKMLQAMGSSAEKAKPKRTEFWRSQRPTRNIIESAKGLYNMGVSAAKSLPADHAQAVERKLALFVKESEKLPADLGTALKDERQRAKLTAYIDETKTLRSDLIKTFIEHAGISVGFNSLDGD